jgi:hypothetical protein
MDQTLPPSTRFPLLMFTMSIVYKFDNFVSYIAVLR